YEVLTRRIVEHRNASQCHGGEHRNVNAENGLSDRHRTGLLPHPWRGFDSLDGGILAALRSFMLHAPLAKLLAEGEGGKLKTALNAICHERLKPAARQRLFPEGSGPLDADYHEDSFAALGAAFGWGIIEAGP